METISKNSMTSKISYIPQIHNDQIEANLNVDTIQDPNRIDEKEMVADFGTKLENTAFEAKDLEKISEVKSSEFPSEDQTQKTD